MLGMVVVRDGGPGELRSARSASSNEGDPGWEPRKMEATLGLVYTAQQMAAGIAGCAIVKISPGAEGSLPR